MQVTFRRASLTDAAQIAATGLTVWISTYAIDSVTLEMAEHVLAEFTEKQIRARIADPGAHIWIAEANNGILGFADLTLSARSPLLADQSQSELTRIYVLDRFSQQGIGKKLLQRCSDDAFENGASVVWLSAWTGNIRALAFYKKLGWERIGETTFALGQAAIPNHVFALRNSAPPA